ncbi:hypothetical protein EP331_00310 [bacterium]|nr:MAG: hypothetical protein EP331_00310 [bacterium]
MKKITKSELVDLLDEQQRTIDRLTEDKRYYENESNKWQKEVYKLSHKIEEEKKLRQRIEFEHRLNLLAELKAMSSFLGVANSGATHREKDRLTHGILELNVKKAEELTNQLFNSNYYDQLPF